MNKAINSLEVLRYIQKRMKKCQVPKDAVSCDELNRITHIAKIALTPEYCGERINELHFTQVGNVWVADLQKIKN